MLWLLQPRWCVVRGGGQGGACRVDAAADTRVWMCWGEGGARARLGRRGRGKEVDAIATHVALTSTGQSLGWEWRMAVLASTWSRVEWSGMDVEERKSSRGRGAGMWRRKGSERNERKWQWGECWWLMLLACC